MSGPAHSWTAAMPEAAAASSAACRAPPRCSAVRPVRAAPTDQVMGVRRQRRAGSGTPAAGAAQRGRRGRRVHVDAGQVGGPLTDGSVHVGGARRGPLRPSRFVPAVCPDHAAGMGPREVSEQVETVPQRGRLAQIEAGQRQPGRGGVDMAVHERRRDERSGEVGYSPRRGTARGRRRRCRARRRRRHAPPSRSRRAWPGCARAR